MPFVLGKTLEWTRHSREKMRFYGLSEQRVRRVIHSPRRIEEGIAPDTIAMMQPASFITSTRRVPHSTVLVSNESAQGTQTWKQEIWVMIQKKQVSNDALVTSPHLAKIKNIGILGSAARSEVYVIISAWRYPGMSKQKIHALQDIIQNEYEEYLESKDE